MITNIKIIELDKYLSFHTMLNQKLIKTQRYLKHALSLANLIHLLHPIDVTNSTISSRPKKSYILIGTVKIKVIRSMLKLPT